MGHRPWDDGSPFAGRGSNYSGGLRRLVAARHEKPCTSLQLRDQHGAGEMIPPRRFPTELAGRSPLTLRADRVAIHGAEQSASAFE